MPDGCFGLAVIALSKGVRGGARVLRELENHLQEVQGGQESHPQLLVELLECQPDVVFANLLRKVI